MPRIPLFSASSPSMGGSADSSLSRLPAFLRQESAVSGTADFHTRIFRELNQLERQRAQTAFSPESPFSILQAAQVATRDLNRYSDILPYKHSQVTVHHASEQQQPQLGYINANRITAPPTLLSSLPKDWPGYIATQAPLPHTQARFWKMVEQQNVQVIVCLTVVSQDRTRRAQKAERYWPLAGEIDELEKDLCVRNLGVLESQNDTEYHHFEMWNPQCGAETQRRRILLVHYQGWPDHGVPQRTEHLRDMLFRIRAWKAEQQQQRGRQQGAGFGPMVVHCSAGCGRTGTFCVVDTILSVLEYTKYPYLAPPPSIRYVRPDAAHIGEAAEARVQSGAEENQGRFSDVYDWQSDRDIIQETLSSFRQERMLMVQTADQYSFCYKAVRDLCC